MGPFLLGPNDTPENGIYTGDARILAEAVPDESVDLIFTDPVYQNIDDYRWLAETAVRVLKPRGHLIAFYQTNLNRQTANAIYDGGMNPIWILSSYLRGGPSPRVAVGHTKQKLAHLCLKQHTAMWQHYLIDVIESVTVPKAKKYHDWQKDSKGILRWILDITDPKDIIFDPFVGGGTIPAACKMLGRRYLAFEIIPDIAIDARQRIHNTKLPLFVLQPEQAEMSI